MSNPFTLYGMQASLYTGKVRAYMRRNHIPVIERGAGHPEYTTNILPELGRFIIPAIVTPNGDIVQDGTDILDYFENEGLGREPLYPNDPVMKAVTYLLELFGNEGLLRPAMHYRWNFDDENLDFIKVSFSDVFPAHFDAAGRAAMFDHASGRMRKAAQAFGVFPENYALIETSYTEFLSLLNTHLSENYFLLGNAPTIADYGLFNPLYAHLARDPKPAHLMKTTAPYIWNWVERMNRPEFLEEHTIDNPPQKMFDGNGLPETLLALMNYISQEYLPEILAHIDFANNSLTKQEGALASTEKPMDRVIGFAEFQWRGQDLKTAVMLYRFYLLQRLQDHFEASNANDQSSISKLFRSTNLEGLLMSRTNKRVIRENHLEAWAI